MEAQTSKDLVIFDLDGTLVDSSEDIAWVANRTLEALGHPVMLESAIRERIGWGIKMLLTQIMPHESPERLSEARGVFLDYYAGHLVVKSVLYPGVAETIQMLSAREKRLAVLTNKPYNLSVEILDFFFGGETFEVVFGGDSLDKRKPDPMPVRRILATLGVDAVDAVIVGDSPVDIEAGKGAGIYTIGAAYGFRGTEELEEAGADIIIDSFSELKRILV
ncbi:MAG: HAD-IA family hydrolase [Thermodesulfobacteriota bacterium]